MHFLNFNGKMLANGFLFSASYNMAWPVVTGLGFSATDYK